MHKHVHVFFIILRKKKKYNHCHKVNISGVFGDTRSSCKVVCLILKTCQLTLSLQHNSFSPANCLNWCVFTMNSFVSFNFVSLCHHDLSNVSILETDQHQSKHGFTTHERLASHVVLGEGTGAPVEVPTSIGSWVSGWSELELTFFVEKTANKGTVVRTKAKSLVYEPNIQTLQYFAMLRSPQLLTQIQSSVTLNVSS